MSSRSSSSHAGPQLAPMVRNPPRQEALPPLRTIQDPTSVPVPSHSHMRSFASNLSRLSIETGITHSPYSGFPSPSTSSESGTTSTTTSSRRSSISKSTKRPYCALAEPDTRTKRHASGQRFEADNDPKRAFCQDCDQPYPCGEKKHHEKFQRHNLGVMLQDAENLMFVLLGVKAEKEQSQNNGQTSGLEGDKQEVMRVFFSLFELFALIAIFLSSLCGLEKELSAAIETTIAAANNENPSWREYHLPSWSVMSSSEEGMCHPEKGDTQETKARCKSHSSSDWRRRTLVSYGKKGQHRPDFRLCRRFHRKDASDNNLAPKTAYCRNLHASLSNGGGGGGGRGFDMPSLLRIAIKYAIAPVVTPAA